VYVAAEVAGDVFNNTPAGEYILQIKGATPAFKFTRISVPPIKAQVRCGVREIFVVLGGAASVKHFNIVVS
jgi:hypothetical protein